MSTRNGIGIPRRAMAMRRLARALDVVVDGDDASDGVNSACTISRSHSASSATFEDALMTTGEEEEDAHQTRARRREDGEDDDARAVRTFAETCERFARDVRDEANALRARSLAIREGLEANDEDEANLAATRAEDVLASFTRAEREDDGNEDGNGCYEVVRACASRAREWADARAAYVEAERARVRDAKRAAVETASRNVKEGLRAKDYARAIVDGVCAALAIECADETSEDDAKVREVVAEVTREFRAEADAEMLAACVVDNDGTNASTTLRIDSARIARLLEHVHNISDDELRLRTSAFANVIAERFLEPMIRAGTASVVDVNDGDFLRYNTAETGETVNGDNFIAQESLERALTWLRAKLPSDDVAEAFGANVWARLAKTCVSSWLLNHPSERAIDRTCAVEVVAANCGFVPPPSDGAMTYAGGAVGPLEAQALATEMQEAETRRTAVLAKARTLALGEDNLQILLRSRAEDVEEEEEDKHGHSRTKTRLPFGVGRGCGDETGVSSGVPLLDGAPCTISKGADDLAMHVDEVLRAAIEDLDPNAHRASANLAAAAADCLDLFRACVSAHRAEQLQTIHTSALVFHNDCHHLANRFSASVYSRGLALQERIGRTPALLWPIEPLRALGDATRNAANDRALSEIHAALDLANGFLHSGEVKVKNTIVKAVARARHVLQRAGTASMYLLPRPTGARDAADLALHFARRITLEILSLEDISVDESEALTEIIADAFTTERLVGTKEDAADASNALIRAAGSEWLKAREIGLMLSAPLRDITANWERGSYRALGFTAREIRGLIDALFEDSSLRAECLARVVDVDVDDCP